MATNWPQWRWPATGLVVALCAVSGCATQFKETYYVGVFRHPPAGSLTAIENESAAGSSPVQVYRFRMNGFATFGSKTRFEAGWFPAYALDKVTGENDDIKKFDGGSARDPNAAAGEATRPGDPNAPKPMNTREPRAGTPETPKASPGQKDPTDPVFVVVGPEGQTRVYRDRRLVVFMATDPSPVTSSISSFATQVDTQVTAQLIAAKERRQAQAELQHTRTRNRLQSLRAAIQAAGANDQSGLLDSLVHVALADVPAGGGNP